MWYFLVILLFWLGLVIFFSFGLNFLVRTRLLEACNLLDATASNNLDASRLIRVIYVVPTKMFDAVRSYYHGSRIQHESFCTVGIGYSKAKLRSNFTRILKRRQCLHRRVFHRRVPPTCSIQRRVPSAYSIDAAPISDNNFGRHQLYGDSFNSLKFVVLGGNISSNLGEKS